MKESCITLDFNNMLEKNIGAHGITMEEICEAKKLIGKVHQGVCSKRPMNTWRDLPFNQEEIVQDIEKEAKRIRENFESFVVFGIGGSALGSKALFTALKHLKYNELPAEKRGGPRFYVVDNVDPDGLNALFDVIDPKKTCFHVITKSGNTVETMTQFMTAMGKVEQELGSDFKKNFVFTTDKETGILKKIVDDQGWSSFVVPEGTGGRFSVLCPVGLLSAAVLGLDVRALLKGAGDMDTICSNENVEENPAYMYAMLYYIAMQKGVNISVMLPYSDGLATMAEWYAQLWAESLGKAVDFDGNTVNVGQTPVRALGVTDQHSQIQLYTEGPFDKIIAFIEVENFNTSLTIPNTPINMYDAAYLSGQTFNKLIASERTATEYAITKAGKMNMKIKLHKLDEYTVGALFSVLEMATAAEGEFLRINAFDQPGVEEGKIATFALMGRKGYEEKAKELSQRKAPDSTFIFEY